MHSIVRTRIQRNADYHAAVAEHYAAQQKKSTNGNGQGVPNPDAPPPPPQETSGGRRRGSTPVAAPVQHNGPSSEELAKLVESHSGAAKQLYNVLANDKPQAILKEQAKPAVVRQTTPIRGSGGLRIH
jgi:hypothetical protein